MKDIRRGHVHTYNLIVGNENENKGAAFLLIIVIVVWWSVLVQIQQRQDNYCVFSRKDFVL